MNIKILNNENEIGRYVGEIVADYIKNNSKVVLGFATGDSPITTYKFLIQDHIKNKTDWSNVISFNLDEYIGLEKENKHSYYYFMQKKLFEKVNIDKKNIHIPIGTGDYVNFAKKYDNSIKKFGGIDLQILGLGSNGHIGFNEPPCDFNSKTQVVNLVESTIKANSRFFKTFDEVPKQAVSMGIKTIMQAKKIVLIAYGDNKSFAIKELLEGKISNNVPCTILQKHHDVTVVIDKKAAKLLSKKI